jgi:hypothetical protein
MHTHLLFQVSFLEGERRTGNNNFCLSGELRHITDAGNAKTVFRIGSLNGDRLKPDNRGGCRSDAILSVYENPAERTLKGMI